MKRSELLLYTTALMNLEGIRLSERSQAQKAVASHLCDILEQAKGSRSVVARGQGGGSD